MMIPVAVCDTSIAIIEEDAKNGHARTLNTETPEQLIMNLKTFRSATATD
jgi:hypothetical protein